MASRTVTFKEVRENAAIRCGFSSAASMNTVEAAQLAVFITTAYRKCLEYAPWDEAIITDDNIACDNGRVTWDAIDRASWSEFWTSDPRPADSEAQRILQNAKPDNDGIWLATDLATVCARYTPRAPTFTSAAVVDVTSYNAGALVFDPVSGHCYECIANGSLGSAIADTTKWKSLPILYVLSEAATLYAVAEWKTKEQEHKQAATLSDSASARLNDLFLATQTPVR